MFLPLYTYQLENFSRNDDSLKESIRGGIVLWLIRKSEYMKYIVNNWKKLKLLKIISTKDSRTCWSAFPGAGLIDCSRT